MNLKSCAGTPMHKKKQGAYHPMRKNMRLTGLLIIILCFNVTASVLAQQITLNVKDQPLEKVFDIIQKQSGYTFLYRSAQIVNIRISVTIEKASLETALQQCLKDQPLSFEIVGKTVVIKTKVKPKKAASNSSANTIINGIVTDTVGTPLPGAIIKIKGTNTATIAKPDGTYAITDVPENATLVISVIGYQTQEILVSDLADLYLKVMLKVSVTALNQVSIFSTGYQQIPKERATGSFDQLDNTLINRRVSTNIIDRLDGVASGVYFNGTQPNTVNSG